MEQHAVAQGSHWFGRSTADWAQNVRFIAASLQKCRDALFERLFPA
jgi:hypothetical protein